MQNRPTGTSLLTLFLLYLFMGCSQHSVLPPTALEINLQYAGANRPELEKVLIHFSNNPVDSLKYKAAVFLISNMESKYHYGGEWVDRMDSLFYGNISQLDNAHIKKLRDSLDLNLPKPGKKDIELLYDIQWLPSSYLIKNINDAFASWQSAPWSASVSYDAFCNYILPYISLNELPEYWRDTLKKKYRHILDHAHIPKTMEDVTCALVDEQETWFNYTGKLGYRPGYLSISQILQAKKGTCNEMANLGAYAARALGIPVAIDYAPQYGNIYDTHKWDALILSDTSFLNFEGGESRPGDMSYTFERDHKFAKIFRYRVGWESSSFAAKALQRGIRDIPELLTDPRIKDVTAMYTNVSDIRLPMHGNEGKPVYLCVNQWHDWSAITGGFIKNYSVHFRMMGRGIVYLPMFYSNKKYTVAGSPVLLSVDGHLSILENKKEELQTLRLPRKFPFKKGWKYTISNSMVNARFEASNDSAFINKVVLHKIAPLPVKYNPKQLRDLAWKDRARYDSCWVDVRLKAKDSFRYVRIIFDRPLVFRLGELNFYGQRINHLLTGRPIGNVPDPRLAFDGVPGKSIKLPMDTINTHWVGLDLGGQKEIAHIRYLPASDGNAIQVNKTYELFYWKDKWISLGKQIGTGLPLEFTEVPKGGLYWLHCSDCGSREERIFTYEDGNQVFW
ncbi:MAG: transglutaminase domain-containing protein [Saprospiraceae bacterium]|nr:transglutaminase domain-containing protein [Saprospiraceae bacterium]